MKFEVVICQKDISERNPHACVCTSMHTRLYEHILEREMIDRLPHNFADVCSRMTLAMINLHSHHIFLLMDERINIYHKRYQIYSSLAFSP